MAEESDGIHEFLQSQMRTALLVANQVGEALARSRESRLRELEASDRQEAEALRTRLAAERQAAAVKLQPATQPGWADTASTTEVVEAVETAAQWRGQEPVVDDARRELWDWAKGKGLDFETMQADIDKLRAKLLADRATELRGSALGREDEGAEILRMAAEDLGQAALADVRGDTPRADELRDEAASLEVEGEAEYDSAERREAKAARLDDAGIDKEAIAASMIADTSNALPVSEAVAHAAAGRKGQAKAPAARRARPRGTDRSRGR